MRERERGGETEESVCEMIKLRGIHIQRINPQLYSTI